MDRDDPAVRARLARIWAGAEDAAGAGAGAGASSGVPVRFGVEAGPSAESGFAGSGLAGSGFAAPGYAPAADPLGAWPGPGPGSAASGRVLAALHPGRRALVTLGALGAAIALVVAFTVYRAQPHAEPIAPPAASPAAPAVAPPVVPPATTAAPVATGSGPVATGSGSIVVAVTGRVRHPGLVHLPAGARVADAVAAAGGVLPGTDLSFVNLAAKLVDGQLVVIGVTPPPGTTLGPAGAAGTGTASGPVNLNTATLADLETLPGIGPTLAQRILDYRDAHHGFSRVDELRQVSGIGDARYAQLKDLVTV